MNPPPKEFAEYPRANGPQPVRGPGVYFDMIGDAFRVVFANPKVYFAGGGVIAGLFCVCYAIAILILWPALNMNSTGGRPQQFPIAAFLGFYVALGLGAFFMLVLSQGFVSCYLEEAESGKTSFATFFSPLKRFFPLVVTIFVSQLLTGLGMYMCFAPGIYLMGAFAFAPTVCVHENLGPFESMRRSMEMTKPHVWMVALLIFVASMIGSLGSMACGIGMMFTLPVHYVLKAMHYREFCRPAVTYQPPMMIPPAG